MEASSSPPVDPGTPVADEALARLMGGGVRAARKKRRAKHIEKLRQAAANVKSPTFVYADDDPQPPDTMWLCPRLHARLKPHQRDGIRWLFSHFGRGIERCGCMLADHMGLGKTMQTLGLLNALMGGGTVPLPWRDDGTGTAPAPSTDGAHTIRTALVLVPTSVVPVWPKEALECLGPNAANALNIHTMLDCTAADRGRQLRRWVQDGGVLILGYEMFRVLVLGDATVARKTLCDPGPDMIILDEGHRLRNSGSQLYNAVQRVRTRRRLVLTGYPMQNHLMEYFCMVDYLRPGFLGTKDEFRDRFEIPITNGQCADSDPNDIAYAKQQTWVLHNHVAPIVLRRDGHFLRAQLPPKHEWVVGCRLSPLQYALYKGYAREKLRQYVARGRRAPGKGILQSYHMSLAIVNDPDVLALALRENIAAGGARARIDDNFWIDGHGGGSGGAMGRAVLAQIVEAPLESGDEPWAAEGPFETGHSVTDALLVDDERPALVAEPPSPRPHIATADGSGPTSEHASSTDAPDVVIIEEDDNEPSAPIPATIAPPPVAAATMVATADEIRKQYRAWMRAQLDASDAAMLWEFTTATFTHTRLGFNVRCPVPLESGGQGYCVIRLIDGGAPPEDDAERSKLHDADQLVSINGAPIPRFTSLEDVVGIIQNTPRPVTLGVRRCPLVDGEDVSMVGDVDSSHVGEKLAWAYSLLREHTVGEPRHSGKTQVLLRILREAARTDERVVVFSQSLRTLDRLAELLDRHNAACAKPAATTSSYPYVRLDGRTGTETRHEHLARVNDHGSNLRVILVSTKAGGEGVSMTGATRMVLFDVSWNPSHDHQAMCRCYRYGQTRPVHVYRLVASGTMEEHVYERQVVKETVALHVVDDRAAGRHDKGTVEAMFDVGTLKRKQGTGGGGKRHGHGGQSARRETVGEDHVLEAVVEGGRGWAKEWFRQDTLFAEEGGVRCAEDVGLAALQDYQQELEGRGGVGKRRRVGSTGRAEVIVIE